MLKRKKSPTPLVVVIFLVSIVLFSSCAAKHLPPAPIVGVDIAEVSEGQTVPFNGTLFSPAYLNDYLQWKVGQ